VDNSFYLLESLIHFTNKRHKVLASNIANIDTPDFRAKDLRFSKVFNEEVLGLTDTHERHISSQSEKLKKDTTVLETNLLWADRNNVELDIEMAKMTENALLNQAGIKLLSTKIRMFKDAVKRR
jgi:flagellar basal-body rod protein FlgB